MSRSDNEVRGQLLEPRLDNEVRCQLLESRSDHEVRGELIGVAGELLESEIS